MRSRLGVSQIHSPVFALLFLATLLTAVRNTVELVIKPLPKPKLVAKLGQYFPSPRIGNFLMEMRHFRLARAPNLMAEKCPRVLQVRDNSLETSPPRKTRSQAIVLVQKFASRSSPVRLPLHIPEYPKFLAIRVKGCALLPFSRKFTASPSDSGPSFEYPGCRRRLTQPTNQRLTPEISKTVRPTDSPHRYNSAIPAPMPIKNLRRCNGQQNWKNHLSRGACKLCALLMRHLKPSEPLGRTYSTLNGGHLSGANSFLY